jgi:glutathione synthase/RimK-type ligase-like ATP-grasp enzyme
MRNNDVSLLPEILVIGPPDSRRVTAFVETALRLGAPRVTVRSYLDVIRNCAAPSSGTLVRLESPGGCSATTRALLKAGISALEGDGGVPISAAEIDELACDRGEMLHPRQWFLGWRKVLNDLASRWDSDALRWMSVPDAIVTAFDKLACLNLWSTAGLRIPGQYAGVSTYAELRRIVPDRHARIFVKLRYGYSAMGAVALEWRGDRVRAVTTVETTWANGRPRLFVTKRPRQLLREFEIAWLIDTLGMERIIVEDWLPKARWNGLPYDLRIVMVDGRMCHVVGRANASPFTNLNLDARRMSGEAVFQQIGAEHARLDDLCKRATAALPGAGMLGLDVLVGPGCRKFTLLEANAFGDYLPGLLHQGQTTYEAQLRHAVRSSAGLCT